MSWQDDWSVQILDLIWSRCSSLPIKLKSTTSLYVPTITYISSCMITKIALPCETYHIAKRNVSRKLHDAHLMRCRDSILYRLVEAYFTAHNDWASQHNITIMCRAIPHIMLSFPAIMRQTQDTFPHSRNAFPHSCNAFPHSRIFAFHCASSCSIAHLHVPLRIFVFHHTSSRFTAHLRILSCIFAFSHIFTFHHTSLCFTVI
jgi:hypothetical protein